MKNLKALLIGAFGLVLMVSAFVPVKASPGEAKAKHVVLKSGGPDVTVFNVVADFDHSFDVMPATASYQVYFTSHYAPKAPVKSVLVLPYRLGWQRCNPPDHKHSNHTLKLHRS